MSKPTLLRNTGRQGGRRGQSERCQLSQTSSLSSRDLTVTAMTTMLARSLWLAHHRYFSLFLALYAFVGLYDSEWRKLFCCTTILLAYLVYHAIPTRKAKGNFSTSATLAKVDQASPFT